MKAFLQGEDLWDTVEAETLSIDARKHAKAVSKILTVLDTSLLVHVQGIEKANDLWKKIQDIIAYDGLFRRVHVVREITSTRLVECASTESYIQTIITAVMKLEKMRMDLPEDRIATFLLAGLPEDCSPMIMSVGSLTTALTPDVVKTKILQEVKHGNVDTNTDAQGLFTYTRGRGNWRGTGKSACSRT